GRRFNDSGMLDEHRLDLRRPEPFAGDLDGVVRPAEDVPQAVVVDRRPVAVDPGVGEAGPVGFDVAIRILPEAAGHPDPWRTHDELADLVAYRPPQVVDDVRRDARRR